MKDESGAIRTSIQGPCGSEVAAAGEFSGEVGVGVGALQRWREDAQSRPARDCNVGRAWTARARYAASLAMMFFEPALGLCDPPARPPAQSTSVAP